MGQIETKQTPTREEVSINIPFMPRVNVERDVFGNESVKVGDDIEVKADSQGNGMYRKKNDWFRIDQKSGQHIRLCGGNWPRSNFDCPSIPPSSTSTQPPGGALLPSKAATPKGNGNEPAAVGSAHRVSCEELALAMRQIGQRGEYVPVEIHDLHTKRCVRQLPSNWWPSAWLGSL